MNISGFVSSIFLAAACALPLFEVKAQAADELSQAVRIGVLAGNESPSVESFQDLVETYFSKHPRFELFDRAHIHALLKEQEMSEEDVMKGTEIFPSLDIMLVLEKTAQPFEGISASILETATGIT